VLILYFIHITYIFVVIIEIVYRSVLLIVRLRNALQIHIQHQTHQTYHSLHDVYVIYETID